MAIDPRTGNEKTGGKKDGWPARVARSLPLGPTCAVLGRFRRDRGKPLEEEQMDVLSLDERGRLEAVLPDEVTGENRTEELLEAIYDKLTEIHEELQKIND